MYLFLFLIFLSRRRHRHRRRRLSRSVLGAEGPESKKIKITKLSFSFLFLPSVARPEHLAEKRALPFRLNAIDADDDCDGESSRAQYCMYGCIYYSLSLSHSDRRSEWTRGSNICVRSIHIALRQCEYVHSWVVVVVIIYLSLSNLDRRSRLTRDKLLRCRLIKVERKKESQGLFFSFL